MSTACRLPIPSIEFCQVTIASQARASMSPGNSWTMVSRPCSQPCRLRLGVGALLEKRLEGVEVERLARAESRRPLAGFLEKSPRTLGVIDIRHRHAPVGHGAAGVDLGGLAERSLGFEVIEGVKLRDALVDECWASGFVVVTGK